MKADQLAEKFKTKISDAVVEKDKQSEIATANAGKRTADIDFCKATLKRKGLPFLQELQDRLGEDPFSFAHQIELNYHRPVRVSFTIGNGAPTKITTAYGNIVVTRGCDGSTLKSIPYDFAPNVEPYTSSSGDIMRDKIAKPIKIAMDHSGQ